MADTPDSGGGLAGLLGFFGRGYDPAAAYGGLLTDPATKDAMQARALAAMAGAFAEGAMPVPYRGGIPFAATLGKAGAAAYGGQDALIKARTEAAQQALYGAQGELAKSNVGLNKILGPAYLATIEQAQKEAAAGKTGPLGLLSGAGGTKPTGSDSETYWTPEGLAALRPTEGKYDQIHYPSGDPSTASGAYGFLDSTWRTQAAAAGVDITKWDRAYKAPPEVQDMVAARTPISHWTGVDAQGKPFNAAAQKLATNPAFVTGGARSADTGAPGPGAPSGPLAGLLAVPDIAGRMTAPGGGLPAMAPAVPAPPGAALPPGPAAAAGGAPDAPYQRTQQAAAQGPGAWRRAVDAQEQADLHGTRFNLPPGAGATPVPPVTSTPGGTNGIVPPGVPGPQGGLLAPPPGMGPPGPIPVSTGAAAPPEALPRPAGRLGGIVDALRGPPAGLLAGGAPPIVPVADTGGPPGAPGNLVSGLRPPVTPTEGLLAPPGAGPPAAMPAGAALGPGPGAPPAAPPPAAVPTGPPPTVNLPPMPTTMPPMPTMAPPAPSPAQKMAQGVAGIAALTGHPAPAWLQDLAKMPAQMQMEQYKAYVTAQANMMSKQYEKQLDVAAAGMISYLQSQGALPADLTKMTNEQDLRLRNSLAEKGMMIGSSGHAEFTPEHLAGLAQIKGAEEAAKAQHELVTTTLTFPGEGRPREVQMTRAQAKAVAEGRGVPELGIPEMSGVRVGKPVYSPTETALGTVEAKAIFDQRKVAMDAARSIDVNKEARALIDGGIFTGAGADARTAIAKIGNALGMAGGTTQETIANTESYFATIGRNVGNMIQMFGAGTGLSDADRRFAEAMAAGQHGLDETSMRRILDINDRVSMEAIRQHNEQVKGIPKGATMLDLAVTPPEPYARTPKATPSEAPRERRWNPATGRLE